MSILTAKKNKSVVAAHSNRPFTSPIASAIVTVIAVLWTVPTLGLVVTSLRKKEDISSSGWWTVFTHPNLTLDNFRAVLSTGSGEVGTQGMLPFAINSLAITIPAVVLSVGFGLMAAYALAWIPFRGSDHVFYGLFALQGVPLQLSLLPLLTFFATGVQLFGHTIIPQLHIVGTIASVWLPHAMFGMPLVIYLLHNFVATLPKELMEAARVDGANHFEVFRRIVLPLSLPAVASIAIFQFLWIWNDLLVALVFAGGTDDVAPLTLHLANLGGSLGSHWENVAPAALISIIIPLIVFFSLQRYFVRGLLAGSVKS
ncbi:MAG: carbohydrate ABC transporter permease [Actinomycetota bacterium]|jgi:alpha-glucoside transport system permease protein